MVDINLLKKFESFMQKKLSTKDLYCFKELYQFKIDKTVGRLKEEAVDIAKKII